MNLKILKRQYRQAKRSIYPVFDFTQLVFAYIFRPKNALISSRVRFMNKGEFVTDGPFYFGIICNKLGSLMSDQGLLKIAGNGKLMCGQNVKISSGCKLHVNGTVNIGANTYIMPHTLVAINSSLKIGKRLCYFLELPDYG